MEAAAANVMGGRLVGLEGFASNATALERL